MKRLPDWMLRYEALVQERLHTRFAFGVHDCSMWPCDAALAITGRDPAADLRGVYSTEEEAAQLIAGHGSLAEMAAQRFGPEISPRMAACGDIGLTQTDRGPALAVCNGAGWLAAAAFGLAHVHRSQIERAWRVEVE